MIQDFLLPPRLQQREVIIVSANDIVSCKSKSSKEKKTTTLDIAVFLIALYFIIFFNNSLVNGTIAKSIRMILTIIIEPNHLKTLTPKVNNKRAIIPVLTFPSLIGAHDLLHASAIADIVSCFFAFSSRSLSKIRIFASILIPSVRIIAAKPLNDITNHTNLRIPPR